MCCRPRRHGNLEFPWNLGLFLEKGWKHVCILDWKSKSREPTPHWESRP